MTYAVIRTGGKQYRVAPGDTIRVEKLSGNDGEKVEFADVLLVNESDQPKLGNPTVAGAKVVGEILSQGRGEKLVVFKFKRRKRYRRKSGHRQAFTEIKITGVEA